MALTNEEERVLATIAALCKGDTSTPVTIGAIHGRCQDLDVRDLVRCLKVLLHNGYVENVKPAPEGIGNSFYLTTKGREYCGG
jgi:hypothetical protein